MDTIRMMSFIVLMPGSIVVPVIRIPCIECTEEWHEMTPVYVGMFPLPQLVFVEHVPYKRNPLQPQGFG